jgi:ABC-type uncharacterized transport system
MRPATPPASAEPPPQTRAAQVRAGLLVVLFFVVGLGLGGFWAYRAPSRPAAYSVPKPAANGLSQATLAVLRHLNGPVEIRFYALLDPASVPATLRSFGDRVNRLLSAYENAGQDRLKVARYRSPADDAAAAAAAGLQAFNRDKGQACFLGLTVAANGQTAVLPRLTPEWEVAVEPDLSRAIERLERPKQPPLTRSAPTDTNAIAQVRHAIPNLASVSVKQGTQMLRAAALKDFSAATRQMQPQVQEAQQRLIQARHSGSAAEQQAALRQLRQAQAAQTERLQQIAARLQAQITALQQLKQN